MYISPIYNMQFKGKTKFLSCNSDGKSKTISDYPFGTASFGDTKGLSEFVKKHSVKTGSVEETIGKFHDNITGKIYIADPKEIVNDLIRQNHDYVVYDFEPAFPDVKNHYFTPDRVISKGFQDIKDYLSRLEAIEQKPTKEIQRKQKTVDLCSQIYDEGADLLEKKFLLENKINNRKIRISGINDDVKKHKLLLEKSKKHIVKQQQLLEAKDRIIADYKYRIEKIPRKTERELKKLENVKIWLKKCETTREYILMKIEKYKTNIENAEAFLTDAPRKIEKFQNEINIYEQKLAKVMQELMPKFHKLCDTYTQNGIKIVKIV